jgi:hypothetical protein
VHSKKMKGKEKIKGMKGKDKGKISSTDTKRGALGEKIYLYWEEEPEIPLGRRFDGNLTVNM